MRDINVSRPFSRYTHLRLYRNNIHGVGGDFLHGAAIALYANTKL